MALRSWLCLLSLPVVLLLLSSSALASDLPRGGVHMDVLDAGETGPPIEHRTVTRHHAFRAEAGERWEFLLLSEAFDAYLYLLDADGRVVAFDDDGAGNLDSRITWRAPHDGTWTLVATSFGGSNEGPYELRTAPLEVVPAQVRTLEFGAWNRDVFGEGAGRGEDGVRRAVYRFEIDQPTRARLEVQGGGWDHDISVIGPYFDRVHAEGMHWGALPDGVHNLNLLWPGTYRVVIATSLASTGTSLRFRLDAASDAEHSPAQAMPESGMATGILVPGTRNEGDRWTLPIEAGELLVVELRSTEFDAYLLLEDEHGNLVFEDDDSGGDLDSRIVFRAPRSATWTLVATSFSDLEEGNYELEVRRRTTPDRVEARRLRPGREVRGDLSEPDFIASEFPQGPGRAYRFEADAGQRLHVDLRGEGHYFELVDPTGEVHGTTPMFADFHDHGHFGHPPHGLGGTAVSGARPAGLVDLPVGGAYLLFVRGDFDAGPYRLTISLSPQPVAQERRMDLASGVTGTFGDDSLIEPWGGFFGTWYLEIEEPSWVRLDGQGDSAQVTLELRSLDGGSVRNLLEDEHNYHAMVHGSPSFAANLLPGRYALVVRQPERMRTSWSVRAETDEIRTPEVHAISIGELANSSMDGVMLVAPGRSTPGVPWRVELEAGQTVEIIMRSTDFDAYLVLVSQDGDVVAIDDDSGGNLDALIRYTSPDDGEFIIYATSFGGSTSGQYTLEVQAR